MSQHGVSVLHVSPAWPPITDGVAMVVLSYARWMGRFGADFACLVPKASGWRDVDARLSLAGTIRCCAVPRPFARPYAVPLVGPIAKARLRRLRPDLVHIHYPIVMGAAALRYARRRGLPVVMTFHTRYADQVRRAVRWKRLADAIVAAIVRFFEEADEVWVPSAEARAVLRGYGYTGPEPVVMELGTDLPVPDSKEQAMRRAAGRALIAPGHTEHVHTEHVLLYLGNLIETKNVDLILDATALLRSTAEPLIVVFAGDGYYRRALQSRARSLGIDDALLFLGPIGDRERVRDLLAASDLLLFPSVADTAGLVRIEAAAYALPVVVVNEPCASAGIEDGINGFVAENDAASYARAIRRALADADVRRLVGERARGSLYRTWESHVRTAVEHYRAIVEADAPTRRTRSGTREARRAWPPWSRSTRCS